MRTRTAMSSKKGLFARPKRIVKRNIQLENRMIMDIPAEQRDAISLILSHKKANGERGFFLSLLPTQETYQPTKKNQLVLQKRLLLVACLPSPFKMLKCGNI